MSDRTSGQPAKAGPYRRVIPGPDAAAWSTTEIVARLLAELGELGEGVEVLGSRAAEHGGAKLRRPLGDVDLALPKIIRVLMQDERESAYADTFTDLLKESIERVNNDVPDTTLAVSDTHKHYTGEAVAISIKGTTEGREVSVTLDTDVTSSAFLATLKAASSFQRIFPSGRNPDNVRFHSVEEVLAGKVAAVIGGLQQKRIERDDMKHVLDAARILTSCEIDVDKYRAVLHHLLQEDSIDQDTNFEFPHYARALSDYGKMCKRVGAEDPLSYREAAEIWVEFNHSVMANSEPGSVWVPGHGLVDKKKLLPEAILTGTKPPIGREETAKNLGVKEKPIRNIDSFIKPGKNIKK